MDLSSTNPGVQFSAATVSADITNDDLFADLQLSLSRLPGTILPGSPISYQVLVQNLSEVVAVPAAAFQFSASAQHTSISWTCTANPGSNCPASGNGVPAHSISLGIGSNVSYTLNATVAAGTGSGETLSSSASISATAPYSDPVGANNNGSVNTPLTGDAVFEDGFESP